MNRKLKKILPVLLLLVVLVAVIGLYGLVKASDEEKAVEEAAAEKVDESITLLEFDPDSISYIDCVNEYTTLRFTRTAAESEDKGPGWVLEGEDGFRLNESLVDYMASKLALLEADYEVSGVTDLSDYGLSDPAVTISFEENGQEHTVLVGDAYPYGSMRYFCLDGATDTVYVTGAEIYSRFNKSLTDLYKAYQKPDFDSTNIVKFTFNVGTYDPYEVVFDEEAPVDPTGENPWVLKINDKEYMADVDKLYEVFETLSNISFATTVDYKEENLSLYGFDDPWGTITIEYEVEDEVPDSDESGEEAEVTYHVESFTIELGESTTDLDVYIRPVPESVVSTMAIDDLTGLVISDLSEFVTN